MDGCIGTYTVNNMITVAPKPIADFTPLPSTTTMDNPTISFIDNLSNASNWIWSFGDPMLAALMLLQSNLLRILMAIRELM